MYCTQCGRKLEENARFCQSCGHRVATGDAKSENVFSDDQNSNDGKWAFEQTEKNDYAAAQTAYGRVLKSPAFLIAAVAFSVFVGFAAINVFSLTSLINILLSMLGALGDFSVQSSTNLVVFIGILLVLPSIASLVGIWLIYAGAQSHDRLPYGVIGAKLLKVCAYINLVCMILLLAVTEIGVVKTLIDVDLSGLLLGLFQMVLWGAFYGAMISYDSRAIQMLVGTAETLQNGAPCYGISMYVAIMSCIIGGFSAVASMSALSFGQYAIGIFLMLAAFAVAMICFGYVLLSLRKQIERDGQKD